uniref:Acireductone dioxygenase n=1 Tax=Grammatophora oceanica TaxID=210454 RepID=A0A7S1VHS5_9STRA
MSTAATETPTIKEEEKVTSPPETKKQKMALEQSPDAEWPEAWLMSDDVKDQRNLNKCDPNVPVDAAGMRDLGICYWKLDADAYTYPVKAVPWDPKDAVDPKLSQLRDDRGYSYADIITIHPDHLPEYEKKLKSFFEEHIHDAEEIRYILGGSGFFDIRNKDDKWVRVHVKKGDLMTLPEGIYHRFTCDDKNIIHAMRLFIGQPVWTPFNRPAEEHPSRKKYVDGFLEEEKKTD